MSARKKEIRIEHDVMGPVKVPHNAYYGVFTVRAAKNFPISGMRINPMLNKAYIQIKLAAAQANGSLKTIEKKKAAAIVRACKKLLKEYESFEDQFILDVFQAGAGTPWHMNVNEVIANVAIELLGSRKGNYAVIDPHNDVNYGQSSNGVTPTAIRIAALQTIIVLESQISLFVKALEKKAKEFNSFLKSGRTHLMDAVPITLGKDFGAWAAAIKKRHEHLKFAKKNLLYLQIGGSAIGTGLNAHKQFSKETVKNLRKNLGLSFVVAKNKIEETQFMGDLLDVSASLRSLAVDLTKIANDLRLMSSGPTTGLNEITLPQVEPGSSIMPSKFNPSMPEMLNMVCYQVMGNDEVVKEASAAGQLELNPMTPIIAHNLLQSIQIMTAALKESTDKCILGIKANPETLQRYLENNPAIATVLNPIIGYDKTALLIKEAIKKKKSVKQLAIEKNILSKEEAQKLFSKKNFRL